MGLPTGVEFIGKSIRIRFTWNGERRSETLAFPQTAKGIKAAADLRAQVVSLAKHGALDQQRYAELFPNSSQVARTAEVTLGEYAQVWLDGLEIVAGTRLNYKGVMNNYWMPRLAARPMAAITTLEIRAVIAEMEWRSSTIKRTAIAQLNALMRAAVRDGVIEKNPAEVIQLPARVKKTIDPFSAEEANAIIDWLYQNLTPATQIFAAFFEFAFYTGMRTGEIMGLMWREVDLDKRTVYVRRIVVDKGVAERTKTKYTRTVMLNSRAVGALQKAQELARAQRENRRRVRGDSPFVFAPSGRSAHMRGASTPAIHFAKALEALNIRPRSQYNCRHTHATMCLMAGMNPAFIAGQLGHGIQVLLSTYARWLSSSNDWTEVGKLENRIGTKLVQD